MNARCILSVRPTPLGTVFVLRGSWALFATLAIVTVPPPSRLT